MSTKVNILSLISGEEENYLLLFDGSQIIEDVPISINNANPYDAKIIKSLFPLSNGRVLIALQEDKLSPILLHIIYINSGEIVNVKYDVVETITLPVVKSKDILLIDDKLVNFIDDIPQIIKDKIDYRNIILPIYNGEYLNNGQYMGFDNFINPTMYIVNNENKIISEYYFGSFKPILWIKEYLLSNNIIFGQTSKGIQIHDGKESTIWEWKDIFDIKDFTDHTIKATAFITESMIVIGCIAYSWVYPATDKTTYVTIIRLNSDIDIKSNIKPNIESYFIKNIAWPEEDIPTKPKLPHWEVDIKQIDDIGFLLERGYTWNIGSLGGYYSDDEDDYNNDDNEAKNVEFQVLSELHWYYKSRIEPIYYAGIGKSAVMDHGNYKEEYLNTAKSALDIYEPLKEIVSEYII